VKHAAMQAARAVREGLRTRLQAGQEAKQAA
jgi:hypothetical protein